MKLVTVLTSLLMSAPLFAGWAGNGGELNRDQNNMWFLGDEPVTYCIESARDFGLTHDELNAVVQESLSEWKLFFHKYEFDTLKFGIPTTFSGVFPDHRLRGLSLNYVEKAHCLNPDKEVIFAFGTTPSVVRLHIEQVPSELGAAIRSEYDHQTYRSGGYVWIAPKITTRPNMGEPRQVSWGSKRPLLKHMIVHEMGHVFGMPHDSVSVMATQVGDLISELASGEFGTVELGQVETATQHYMWKEGQTIPLCGERRYGGAFNLPDEVCLNSELPPDVTASYKLEKEKWHKRFLHIRDFQHMTLEIVPSEGESFNFEVTGTNLGQPLTGMLYGPSLYSRWESQGHFYWYTSFMDFHSSVLPFVGAITIRGEKRAVTIDASTKVSIFDSKSGTWAILRPFP